MCVCVFGGYDTRDIEPFRMNLSTLALALAYPRLQDSSMLRLSSQGAWTWFILNVCTDQVSPCTWIDERVHMRTPTTSLSHPLA